VWFSSEDAEQGAIKQTREEKVVGVWDAEIKKFNEAEDGKKKEKGAEVVEEAAQNEESVSEGQGLEKDEESVEE